MPIYHLVTMNTSNVAVIIIIIFNIVAMSVDLPLSVS